MDERLKKAAEEGDVNALYELLALDPYLLERIDRIPIFETPLHISASSGKTHFAMEVMSLKPSLAWKLNQIGLSPMHLALQNGHLQTVRGLITIDSELIRVKGRERITPLHYVAEIEDTDLLAEFLTSCPSSIEDLTVRCETAVHVAVKNLRSKAFKVLFGWLRRVDKEDILNWKDDDGNTVLHIATSKNLLEVIKLLVKRVKINVKNFGGLTAMDIFLLQGDLQLREIGHILSGAKAKGSSELSGSTVSLTDYLSRELSLIEKRDKYLGINGLRQRNSPDDIRHVVLVVAILIATATFQAGLCPPGGYWQDNYNPPANNTNSSSDTDLANGQLEPHRAGQMIMGPYLVYFFTFNTAAFCVSMWVIVVFIMGLPYSKPLYLSICCLLYAYYASLSTTYPLQLEVSPSTVLVFLVYIVTMVIKLIPVIIYIKHQRLKRRVDTLKRRPGNLV